MSQATIPAEARITCESCGKRPATATVELPGAEPFEVCGPCQP